MNIIHRKDHIMLFLGDICVLAVSLVLTLIIRYRAFPSTSLLELHLAPFSFLFVAFILVYFIAGLYDKHTNLLKNRLPITLLNVQLANTVVGISFFYFIPYFYITPKIVLFLFLILSLILMYGWRIFVIFRFKSNKKQKAILIADSAEAHQLREEINGNSRYNLQFIETINPNIDKNKIISDVRNLLSIKHITMIVVDIQNQNIKDLVPMLYPIAMQGVLLFNIEKIYETIFDRIPVSTVSQTWFIEHMSSMTPKLIYDGIKRLIDIVVAAVFGIISLFLYPFIILAMKIEDDNGVIFSYQKRIGQYNKMIRIIKFRTMTIANDEGKWENGNNKVTTVGLFLRKTRIDELPQLWNILKGDVSLIGPRPEFPEAVIKYSEEIPNYTIRHSVKPGLSGWAQIYHEKHPHHGVDIEETANKLSYDLYYVKHRSFLLDLKIALRTIKVLMTFVGR